MSGTERETGKQPAEENKDDKTRQGFRTPFENLLASFAAHAHSEREKGAYFENLTKIYLEKEPKWADIYRKIWHFSDWRKQHWDGGEQDNIGIDLVAETHEGEFHAIQCKFYSRKLNQDDLKHFTNAPESKFPQLILATTSGWNDNVDDLIKIMGGRLKTLTRQDFEDSQLKWETYDPESQTVALKERQKIRDYQESAVSAARRHFAAADRGKMIMACGTGKTFTSLKIAETFALDDSAGGGIKPEGANILFLVPSLALLSQTLTSWKQQAAIPMSAFAVCSDISVGKRKADDDEMQYVVHEVSYPTNTSPESIAANFAKDSAKNPAKMRVIFCTYQSLDVIARAQAEYGLPAFDLAICDEAHRTTGQTDKNAKSDKNSNFILIHDEHKIHAAKRLYMTATPRIYKDAAKKTAKEQDIILYSMDNEQWFGKEFYILSFSEAVHRKLLVDYKLIVLTIEEKVIKSRLQNLLLSDDNDIVTDDAAKIIGCWKALAKKFRENAIAKGQKEEIYDTLPMKRAVAFAQTIDSKNTVRSKQIAKDFPKVVEAYQKWQAENPEIDEPINLSVEARHVDGSMNAQKKGAELQWLKEPAPDDTCRILSNVRCLSEGVDVPALDAVLFLTARNSQVDVVQSVGRVMRRSEGKKLGYVILPVVIPSGEAPDKVLANSKNWQVVWQVVNALRAHDPKIANSIARAEMGDFSGKIEICALADLAPKQVKACAVDRQRKGKSVGTRERKPDDNAQGELEYEPTDLERGIIALMVKKCGTRLYWDQWGERIAKIGGKYKDSLNTILDNPANEQARGCFQEFLAELHSSLNDSISREQAITMLAEQIIAMPIFNALFGQYHFAEHNPIAIALQKFLDSLQGFGIEKEGASLQDLYEEIEEQIGSLPDSGKQDILKTIYQTIIHAMEPENAKTVVYTPVPVADFINASVAYLLEKEFGESFNSPNVSVLEPFAGTGTFLARLLKSGHIMPAALPDFYQNRLWASEINLLAYYTACANIEAAYHEQASGEYLPFKHIAFTDTFTLPTSLHDGGQRNIKFQYFGANYEIIEALNEAAITVIAGNPPYGSDMTRAYTEGVDKHIGETYEIDSAATLNNSLYDGYIRAFRWATDRIKDKGIIAFITNAGFLGTAAAAGLRKHLAEDFSNLYIFNLRGNIRGELGNKAGDKLEGGNIFDVQVGVAISVLVKNPNSAEKGKIHYCNIGDGLNKAEKLEILEETAANGGVKALADKWQILMPDEHNDWLNQRDDSFSQFMLLGYKKDKGADVLFNNYSNGVKTNRDAWVYNFSRITLSSNMESMISFYNQCAIQTKILEDNKKISWTRELIADCEKGRLGQFEAENIVLSVYRPFMRSYLYYSRQFNNCVYQMPQIFPNLGGKCAENLVIGGSGIGGNNFSAFVLDSLPDLNMLAAGAQNFPLYLYEEIEDEWEANSLLAHQEVGLCERGTIIIDKDGRKLRKKSAITPEGQAHFREFYGEQNISAENIFYYIYGLLHSPEYREKYANNLKKELPRIPRVKTYADFCAFSKAGRELADLHLHFDDFGGKGAKELAEQSGVVLDLPDRTLHFEDYLIKDKMRYGGRIGAKDKSVIHYNPHITIRGIPDEAHDYVINGRSAIDWVIDRWQVKTDKASGITNDPNAWGEEHNDRAYPLKLLLNVISLSFKTQQIVNSLPALDLENPV